MPRASQTSALPHELETDREGIAWLTFDRAGSTTNTFSAEVTQPEGGGGCSCGNWLETSLVFAPREQMTAAQVTSEIR